MEEIKIDLVIAYVNNNDKVWQDTFLALCCKYSCYNKYATSLRGNRYDDFGLFEYNLKLIMKNMPWLNNIYLLVSNKEQVIPSLLPPNCEIVLHEQFIPRQFLPTFNSCTIEMFLWNIKGLEEHFIYINDDMYPIKPLLPTQFFVKTDKEEYIRFKYLEEELTEGSTQFRKVCYNSYKKVIDKVESVNYKHDQFLRPIHSFTPIIKSHARKIYKALESDISKNIGRFRTERQVNQYIYPLYEKLKYGTLPINYKFQYLELGYELENIDNGFKVNDIVCINDNGKDKVDINIIKERFSEALNEL